MNEFQGMDVCIFGKSLWPFSIQVIELQKAYRKDEQIDKCILCYCSIKSKVFTKTGLDAKTKWLHVRMHIQNAMVENGPSIHTINLQWITQLLHKQRLMYYYAKPTLNIHHDKSLPLTKTLSQRNSLHIVIKLLSYLFGSERVLNKPTETLKQTTQQHFLEKMDKCNEAKIVVTKVMQF